MATVTGIIKAVKQPRGGYLKPSSMTMKQLDDNIILNENESIHPTLMGLSVDYLTRYMLGRDAREAFDISIKGAKIANKMEVALLLLSEIKGLDDKSIESAVQLTTFDVWYRDPITALKTRGYNEINIDNDTIENIRIMVNRSMNFFDEYGPITVDGFTFEPNGYTSTVNCGDGDFLTKETLWDFKVSKKKPVSTMTLQLIMYYIMGKHSGNEIFSNIHNVGIFNPRLNQVYLYDMNMMSSDTIKEIEKDVICY